MTAGSATISSPMNERQISVSMMMAAKDHIWSALQTGYSAVLKTQLWTFRSSFGLPNFGRPFMWQQRRSERQGLGKTRRPHVRWRRSAFGDSGPLLLLPCASRLPLPF